MFVFYYKQSCCLYFFFPHFFCPVWSFAHPITVHFNRIGWRLAHASSKPLYLLNLLRAMYQLLSSVNKSSQMPIISWYHSDWQQKLILSLKPRKHGQFFSWTTCVTHKLPLTERTPFCCATQGIPFHSW